MKTYAAAVDGIQYFGRWVFDGTRRYTSTLFSRCVFTFRGPQIRLLLNTAPNCGNAQIILDGEDQGIISCRNTERVKELRFEKNVSLSREIHELWVVCADGKIEIGAFEAECIVNYALELHDKKVEEYALVASGLRSAESPELWHPVPYGAVCDASSVELLDTLFSTLIRHNTEIIKYDFALPFYCEGDGPDIEGVPGPGWSHFLPASNEARLLGGACNTLKLGEDEELRVLSQKILSDMKTRKRADGYYNYYPESESFGIQDSPLNERKNYDRVFWTRAMLYAAEAGETEALSLAREMYDWLEQAENYLPTMLEGTNATNAGPGLPLMANSPAAKPSDLQTAQKFFDQNYFMDALCGGVSLAFWAYPAHQPHCYTLLILETILDEYRATGEKRYLDAVLGGWDIWRKHYKHLGGAAAVCEVDGPYPPSSRYITTGHNGETCASVFWSIINAQLMQLFPGDDRFAAELEECLFNAVAACRRAEDGWTRYHVRFHGEKEFARNYNHCCEVASTLFLPTIPSYIYSVAENDIYINFYSASKLKHGQLHIEQKTSFPLDGQIELKLHPKTVKVQTLHLRIPSWANGASVLLNGEKLSAVPGTYLALSRVWEEGDCLRISLPMNPRFVEYTGDDRPEDNGRRYAMLCGPILMALTGMGKESVLPLRNRLTITPTMPHLEGTPAEILQSLTPDDGMTYHIGEYTYMPYFAVNKEYFTCYPEIG